MIQKGTIFYFVRKVVEGFPKEIQEKLKGVRIVVYEDEIRMNTEKSKSEIAGSWNKKFRVIEFFMSTIRNYVAREKDIYTALRKIESVVEHELLHAAGFDHKQINQYRKGKKNGKDKEV